MKRKLSLLSLFICIVSVLSAQTNKTTISYDLKRTFTSNGGAVIGGDLTIGEEETNTVPVCSSENTIAQNIYTGKLLSTIFLNVDNSLGQGCILLEVKSGTATIRQTIPAGGISGLLSFNKVTSVSVIIAQKITQAVPETVIAKGTVDFWF